MPDINLSTLQMKLKRADARWTARPNQRYGLSDDQKHSLLGVVVDQPAGGLTSTFGIYGGMGSAGTAGKTWEEG